MTAEQLTKRLLKHARAEIAKYERVAKDCSPGHVNSIAALERTYVWEEVVEFLKSPAGPVQPSRASPARESDHAGL